MKPHEPPPHGAPLRGPGDHPLWWGAFVALLAAQTWMTLGLFGPGHAADRLFDDQPILSGRHPLHLYHGLLGARAFLARGTLSCYDPAFQAGYPKTPVFDDGSRPAEMLLALAGGRYLPWVYKLGVVGLCLLAPCVFAGAARGGAEPLPGLSGLRPGNAGVVGPAVPRSARSGGCGAAAGVPGRAGADGTADALPPRAPGPLSAAGVTLAAFVGWFADPMLMLLSAPLLLLYYFTSGPHHKLLWHVSLAGALAASVLANLFWLLDWAGSWWIHTPLNLEAPVLTAHTLRALWEAPAWGASADRTLACFLVVAALVGVVWMHRGRLRPAARLFGLGLIGWLLLAGTAVVWGPLARFGGDRLFVPALLFAAAPAAHALTTMLRPIRRWGGWGTAALAGAGTLAAVTLALPSHRDAWVGRWRDAEPFRIGLGADRENIAAVLKEKTNSQARILWEDRRGPRDGFGWTALLPVLTDRAYVGGLDPDADIEHTAGGLVDQTLAGRPIDDWTDADLQRLLHALQHRLGGLLVGEDGAAVRALPPRGGGDRSGGGAARRRLRLAGHAAPYAVVRPARRRPLADGRLQPRRADGRAPGDDHQVVLSLHYQAGLRVSPSRIHIERHPDSQEAIPFVRLWLDEPAPVVTITWDKR